MKFMWESFDDVLQAELQGDNRFTDFARLSERIIAGTCAGNIQHSKVLS